MQTFFHDWHTFTHVLVVSVLGYASLLLLIRLSGKRSLAKLNIFDFVVVVALGSVFANAITTPSTSLADAVAAFALLLGLQFLFSLATRSSSRIEALVNGRATLLLYRGRLLEDRLRGQRVTIEEVRAAARAAGASRLEDIEAIVLETNGQFSVLREVASPSVDDSTLADVQGMPSEAEIGPRIGLVQGPAERRRR